MEKQEQAKPVRGQNLLEWYEALISAALVLVLIFSFFYRIIQVDGSSMVPTLVNGDKPVSYTHLDVYKRQVHLCRAGCRPVRPPAGGRGRGHCPADDRRYHQMCIRDSIMGDLLDELENNGAFY